MRHWNIIGSTPVQARIQDSEGGGFVHSEGGGGFVKEFQERIQIVAGSWANQQAKKIADSRGGGGGSEHPPKKPVSAHAVHVQMYIHTTDYISTQIKT